jgi:hypothetical protein
MQHVSIEHSVMLTAEKHLDAEQWDGEKMFRFAHHDIAIIDRISAGAAEWQHE